VLERLERFERLLFLADEADAGEYVGGKYFNFSL